MKRLFALLLVVTLGLFLVARTMCRSTDGEGPSKPRPVSATEAGRVPRPAGPIIEACRVRVEVTGATATQRGLLCVARGDGQRVLDFPRCVPAERAMEVEIDGPGASAIWPAFSGAVVGPPVAWPSQCGVTASFALTSGVTTTGVVRDSSGGIISGALITSSAGMAVSDDEGLFSLTSPATRRFIDLSAHASGYASVNTRTSAGRQGLEIFLIPESVIRGVVRDERGAPQANVVVQAEGSAGLAAHSDANGAFELHNLRPGMYSVSGTALGVRATSPEPVVVGFASIVDGVDLVLKPAPALLAHVSIAGAKPCSTGRVQLTAITGERLEQELSGTGDASFTAIRAGRYDALVRCEDYPEATFPTIEIQGTERREVLWTIEAGQKAAIRVVSADREPIGGLHVDIMNPDGSYLTSVKTDAGGEVVAAGLPEGRVEAVVESKFGDGKAWVETARDSSRVTELLLGRSRFGTLTGVVRIRGGARGAALAVVARGSERTYTAVPGPDGAFEFTVPAGEYEFFAHASLHTIAPPGTPRSPGVFATVQSGQAANPLELDFEISKARLHGDVREHDGAAAPDVIITVRSDEDPYFKRELLTASSGRFEIDDLIGGWRYRITATSPDGRSIERQQIAAGHDIVLNLPRSRHFCGKVSDAGGQAIGAFRVTLISPQGARPFEFSRVDGSWCVAEIGEANEVLIQADSGAALQPIAGDEMSTRLTGFASLSGRLLGPGGEPVGGAMLWLRKPGTNLTVGPAEETDAQGAFVVRGPAGDLELVIEPFGEMRSLRGARPVSLPGTNLDVMLAAP